MARSRNHQKSRKWIGEIQDILRRRALKAPDTTFDPEEIVVPAVPESVQPSKRSFCSWIFAGRQKIVVERLNETATAHVSLI